MRAMVEEARKQQKLKKIRYGKVNEQRMKPLKRDVSELRMIAVKLSSIKHERMVWKMRMEGEVGLSLTLAIHDWNVMERDGDPITIKTRNACPDTVERVVKRCQEVVQEELDLANCHLGELEQMEM